MLILNIVKKTDKMEQCFPDDYAQSIEEKIVAIRLSSLRPEYHAAAFQIEYLKFGNGAIHTPEGGTVDTYEIYQILGAKDTQYMFRSFSEAKKYFSPTDYERVYAAVLGGRIGLENIFMGHDSDRRPFSDRMRSLSMSDVVVLNRGGEKSAHYVDTFGFTEVPQFFWDEKSEQKKPKSKDS